MDVRRSSVTLGQCLPHMCARRHFSDRKGDLLLPRLHSLPRGCDCSIDCVSGWTGNTLASDEPVELESVSAHLFLELCALLKVGAHHEKLSAHVFKRAQISCR